MRVAAPCILCLLLSLPLPAGAQELRIEAERFNESENLSHLPIQGMDNPACSGGVSLVGLDRAGEWTLYDDLSITRGGTYSLSVHFRAETGQPVLLRLTLTPLKNPDPESTPGASRSEAAIALADGGATREIELALPGQGFG
jgi:hypothetical protein